MSDINDPEPPRGQGGVPDVRDEAFAAAGAVVVDAAAAVVDAAAAVDDAAVEEAAGAAFKAAAVEAAGVDAASAASSTAASTVAAVAAATDEAFAVDAAAAAAAISPFQVVWNGLDDPFPHLVEEHEARLRRRGHALEAADGHHHYYEDTSDSDDETNLVDQGQHVLDPCLATAIMVDVTHTYRRYRIRELTVNWNHGVPDGWRRRNTGRTGDDDHDEYAVQFRRFGNNLERCRRIRELHVTRGNFWHDPRDEDDDDNLEEEEWDDDPVDGFDIALRLEGESLNKFFGEVLPCHASLREITISHSRIETQYWRLFTERLLTLPGFALRQLALTSTPLDSEDCRLLRAMLRRRGSLYQLSIEDCGLGADEWQLVCEGVADNGKTHTLTLVESDVTVGPHTLLPLFRPLSQVDRLVVRAASWADDDSHQEDSGAFVRFLRELRGNAGGIRELELHRADHRAFPHGPLVEDMLTAHNWTLERVVLHPAPAGDPAWVGRIRSLLERNRRARSLVTLFDTTPPHGLSPLSMWPLVLQERGRFPALVYRFLRKQNVEAFCEHLQASVVAAAPAAAASRENCALDDPSATATPTAPLDKKRPHQLPSE
jgi:hypothetical protein